MAVLMRLLSVGLLLLISNTLSAADLKSISDAVSRVNVARIVKVVNLVEKENLSLVVNIAVEDLGGSTDVSASQVVYLTMYSKGEIFSTDIAFRIAEAYSFVSARRVKPGIYEVIILDSEMKKKRFTVDAQKVSYEIQNIKGCEEMPCKTSEDFSGTVFVK